MLVVSSRSQREHDADDSERALQERATMAGIAQVLECIGTDVRDDYARATTHRGARPINRGSDEPMLRSKA